MMETKSSKKSANSMKKRNTRASIPLSVMRSRFAKISNSFPHRFAGSFSLRLLAMNKSWTKQTSAKTNNCERISHVALCSKRECLLFSLLHNPRRAKSLPQFLFTNTLRIVWLSADNYQFVCFCTR